MSSNRYYYKKNYKGDYSLFGSALLFTLIGILSIIFKKTNIHFIGLYDWGVWFFLLAFFTFIRAVSSYFNDIRMRNALLGYINMINSNKIKVEDLSARTGIKESNILRILMHLRMKGQIKYKFDPQTGEILVGEQVTYEKSPNFISPPSERQAIELISQNDHSNKQFGYYCPYCGQKNSENDQFCINCGAKLS